LDNYYYVKFSLTVIIFSFIINFMKTRDIEKFKEKIQSFMADLTAEMGRTERRRYAELYVRGLLMDGDRKSVEPIAKRLAEADVQALQQFVNQSPWSFPTVRASLSRKLEDELVPSAYWIINEVFFPKKGVHSAGVAYQYCRKPDKTTNCQVAVKLDLGTEELTMPLSWALYLPEEWIHDAPRREKAAIPEEIVYKNKTELALELIDQAVNWGLQRRLVLADPVFGSDHAFRQGLRSRRLDYLVQVDGHGNCFRCDSYPIGFLMKKARKPAKLSGAAPFKQLQTFQEISNSLSHENWKTVISREGTKEPMSSQFARITICAAESLRQGENAFEQLLIERPEGKRGPEGFWLSSLNLSTSLRTMVKGAKGRFRVENDFHEMKTELGLGHFEGRSWQGWHHHVTLVAIAYGIWLLEKIQEKKNFWIDPALCPPLDPAPAVSAGHESPVRLFRRTKIKG